MMKMASTNMMLLCFLAISSFVPCLGQSSPYEAMTACSTGHLTNGQLTCTDVPAYLACLQAIDTAGDAAAAEALGGQVAQAQTQSGYCTAFTALSACFGGPTSCSNIQEKVDCLKGLNTAAYDDLEANRLNQLATFNNFLKQCNVHQEIAACRPAQINCDTVSGYISCLQGIDTTGLAAQASTVSNIVNQLTPFTVQCSATEESNGQGAADSALLTGCQTTHVPGGSITCENVDAYYACLQQIDVTGTQSVQATKQSTLSSLAPMVDSCSDNALIAACNGRYAPDGSISCDNVQELSDCLTALDLKTDAAKARRDSMGLSPVADKCDAIQHIELCKMGRLNGAPLGCDNVGAYDTCLNFRLDDFAAGSESRTLVSTEIARIQTLVGDCRQNAELDGCHAVIDGTITCDNVAVYISCLEAAKVTEGSAVYTHKLSAIEGATNFQTDSCATPAPVTAAAVAETEGEANAPDDTTEAGNNNGEPSVYNALVACKDTHSPSNTVTCDTAVAFMDCVRPIETGGDAQATALKTSFQDQLEPFAKDCKVRAAKNTCFDVHVEDGSVTCGTAGALVDCLKAIDTFGLANLKAEVDSSLATYGTFKAGCDANNKLKACYDNNSGPFGMACDNVEAYLTCLKNADVSVSPDAEDRKSASIARYEPFKNECAARAQLNGCSTDNLEGGTANCNNVGGYVDCLKGIDVSSVNDVQTDKETKLAQFEAFAAGCSGSQALNDCKKNHITGDKITCEEIDAYLACLKAADVEGNANAQVQKDQAVAAHSFFADECKAYSFINACFDNHGGANQEVGCENVADLRECLMYADVAAFPKVQTVKDDNLRNFGSFQEKCEDLAKIAVCHDTHTTNGKVSCAQVDAYIACLEALDVSRHAIVQADKDNKLRVLRAFSDKCKALGNCVAIWAPDRKLHCGNAQDLKDCFTRSGKSLGQVNSKVEFCINKAPLNLCLNQLEPKGVINCQSGNTLINCLQATNVAAFPRVQRAKIGLIGRADTLMQGKCAPKA